MKSILVIGLGRFGTHLALRLMELGNEVMVVDKDEETVDRIAGQVTRAKIGDCMDEEVLRDLGVANFDICFVCISEDFQSSLEITSLLKDLGAVRVVSKSDRDIHAKFLLRIGADDVIYPERDMAQRAAMKYSSDSIFDYIELTPEYAIFEIEAPAEWVGRPLMELNLRSRYNVNVIGTKLGDKVIPITSPERVFTKGEHIFIAGSKTTLATLVEGE